MLTKVMSKRYSKSWSQTLRVSSVGSNLKIMRSKDNFLARSSGMNFMPLANYNFEIFRMSN
jgi:hypothetical protein